MKRGCIIQLTSRGKKKLLIKWGNVCICVQRLQRCQLAVNLLLTRVEGLLSDSEVGVVVGCRPCLLPTPVPVLYHGRVSGPRPGRLGIQHRSLGRAP